MSRGMICLRLRASNPVSLMLILFARTICADGCLVTDTNDNYSVKTLKKLAIMFLSLLLILFATNASAEPSRVCTEYEAKKAEMIVGKSRSWNELYKNYKLYSHCDDGAIGEGFSESVTLMLTKFWGQIVKLKPLIQKDEAFEAFIIKHIDETVPEKRLELVETLARNKCPRSVKILCEKIRSAAHEKTP